MRDRRLIIGRRAVTRATIAALLAGGWLASAFAAFAMFQDDLLTPFADEETQVFFEGARFRSWVSDLVADAPAEPVTARAGPGEGGADGRVTLVHFRDPACPCAFANDLHVRDVVRALADDVALVVAQPPGTEAPPWLPEGAVLRNDAPLPEGLALPAAAVLDRAAELAYFGPWSLGALCSARDGFVETALAATRAGTPPRALNTLGLGCFCTRREST
jgi:hypothetical protein